MPPQPGRKVIYDTNVYIRAIHGRSANKEYDLLLSSLPFTFLSSVVSGELYAGAMDSIGTRLIHHFVSQSERVGRIVTPTHGSWNEAGRILARISKEEPEYRSKLPALFNDTLIALCALQIGATVCTKDEEDFELIRRHKRLDLQVIGSRG